MKKYPGYLATAVLYAKFYTTKKGNQQEFDQILDKVLAAQLRKDEFYSENVMEQKKAKELKQEKADLF